MGGIVDRMIERIARRLPQLFIVLPVVVGAIVFWVDSTKYLPESRVAVYMLFAASTTVLAAGHFALLRRSPDGRGSVWLTAFAYSQASFAIALWAIMVLVALRLHYGIGMVRELFIAHILYGVVAAAMTGTALAAVVFLIGYRKHCLQYRIRWKPWPRRRRRR